MGPPTSGHEILIRTVAHGESVGEILHKSRIRHVVRAGASAVLCAGAAENL